MEGEHRLRIPSPPPNSDGDVYDVQEMRVSASDSTSVTGENREETLRFAENAMLSDRGPWTCGKHDMYLNQLELSFVKKLHENKCLHFGSRSDKISLSGRSLRSDASSYERGCQQSINTSRGKPLSSVAAADFHIIIRSASVYKSKYMEMRTSVSKPLGYVNHCHRTKHAQRVASLRSVTEGTGQNFIAENNRNGYSSRTPILGQLTDAAENQPESDLSVINECRSTKP